MRELWEAQMPRWNQGLADLGLTSVQAHALSALAENPPGPMNKLADHLRCDRSWATGLVDQLEQLGHVTRRPSPDDRRIKVVELTPSGVKAHRAVERLMNEPPPGLRALDSSEVRTLLRILRRALDRAPAASRAP